MPHLRDLLAAAGIGVVPPDSDPEITHVVYDSRRAGADSLFVAVPGLQDDGHRHAAAAVRAGASAVVAERIPEPALPSGTPLVLVEDARVALAWLGAALAGHPSRAMTIAGVTGTDGKTTTTTMLWAAWRAAGHTAASVTTVDLRRGDTIEPNTTRQTTFESVELQQTLRDAVTAGCTHMALETSSHALEMRRVDAVAYRAAVFTRVTSEHLELHGTREAYLAAKARLLDLAGAHPQGIGVLDADDDFAYPLLSTKPIATRLTYSATGAATADLRAEAIHTEGGGVRFTARTPWGDADIALQVAGGFNVSNALAALACACATGVRLDDAVRGIAGLDRVDGRMERIVLGQPFAVVIDYAHTADSLAKVLRELRAATAGRLWVVFGSAGERDRDKRPKMGAVAAQLADVAVITDEDPREEDAAAILEEIAAGAIAAGGRRDDDVLVISDRPTAINAAIAGARPGDTVLLAGKGHESCIIIGRENVPYSERAVAEAAVRAHHGTPLDKAPRG